MVRSRQPESSIDPGKTENVEKEVNKGPGRAGWMCETEHTSQGKDPRSQHRHFKATGTELPYGYG